MASFFFDGNNRRIYEVPTNGTYTVDQDGYRLYVGQGSPEKNVRLDVQRDLWSRFQDWVNSNKWSTIALSRSGGNLRGFDEFNNPVYQTNDFSLVTSLGWKLIVANYPHELILRGNLFSDDGAELFDFSHVTVPGAYVRLEGADSLQVYRTNVGSGLDSTQAAQLARLHRLHGLEAGVPLVVTDQGRTAGDISQVITDDGTTTTVTLDE
ncbi:MAG: hypothetical protein AAFN18_12000 [Cyanobacteria bacterium J06554_6]